MLDSTDLSSCTDKTTAEVDLENLIDGLDNQILTDETLLDQAQTAYALSRDAYDAKESIANATFDQFLLDAQDAELKGNNTIDIINDFFGGDYNDTIISYNTTLELLVAQNATYLQSLEDGDPVAIEEAESNLNATILALVSSTYI